MSLAAREPLLIGAPAPVIAAGGAAVALATAIAAAALGSRQISSWPLELASLAALVFAGIVVLLRTNPFRAPFRARSHALVLGLVLLAFALDEGAQHGRNTAIHDDWGLAVLPVFLLVIATLRPPKEVIAGGLMASALVAATVLLLSPSLPTPLPPLARAAEAATQVLPPALAAGALARTTSRLLETRVPRGSPPVGDEVRLSVQQETIARLEAEAVPLLTAVEAAAAVTAAQLERVRAIATELRAALVADLARGWLVESGFAVDDPDGYGERMTADQRTALRTTFASLPLADFDRPGSASVTGQDLDATLTLSLPVVRRPPRPRVAPLVPLLRTAFDRADIRIEDTRVLVIAEFTVAR